MGFASLARARPANGTVAPGSERLRAAYTGSHKSFVKSRRKSLPGRRMDRRFEDPAWASFPYVLWEQAFLAQEEWWRSATRQVRGMSKRVRARRFHGPAGPRDISPSNIPWLNPVIIDRTIKEGATNLLGGGNNARTSACALAWSPTPSMTVTVGEEIAITPARSFFAMS